jgi:hypothetical protein
VKKLNLILTILAIASVSSALNLKQTKTYNQWKEYLSKKSTDGFSDEVVKKCGYEIPVDLDEKTVVPFTAENTSAALFCDATLSTIAQMCEDATAKPMIKKSITKISCVLGKKQESSFKLSGGVLTFTFGLGASNLEEKAKDFLENNLQ